MSDGHTEIANALARHWVDKGRRAGVPPTSILEGFTKRSSLLLDVLIAGQEELVIDLVHLGADPNVTCIADVHNEHASAFAMAVSEHHFEQALMMLAPIFSASPSVAFYACVHLAVKVRDASEKLKTSEPSEHEALSQLADRVAAVHVGLLETLPEQRRLLLLGTPEVGKGMAVAVRAGYLSIFFPSWMHKYFVRQWRGEMLGVIISAKGSAPWGGTIKLPLARRVELLLLVVSIVLPLLVLVVIPLAALAPPLEPALMRWLESLGAEGECEGKYRPTGYCSRYKIWWGSFNLLRAPLFKFVMAHTLNVAFALLVTGPAWGFRWAPSGTHDTGANTLLLVWATCQFACSIWRLGKHEPISLDHGSKLVSSLLIGVACVVARQRGQEAAQQEAVGRMLAKAGPHVTTSYEQSSTTTTLYSLEDDSLLMGVASFAVVLMLLNTSTALMRMSQQVTTRDWLSNATNDCCHTSLSHPLLLHLLLHLHLLLCSSSSAPPPPLLLLLCFSSSAPPPPLLLLLRVPLPPPSASTTRPLGSSAPLCA